MIASHQGLQSLGRVLTLGITCCTITSLITLPAMLTWITRHRTDEVYDREQQGAGRAELFVMPRPVRRRSPPRTRPA
jgi:hypothetical protein